MDQPILTGKGTVVTLWNLRKLRKSELVCEYEKRKPNLFDDVIQEKLGSSISYPENPTPEIYIPYENKSEEPPS